MKLQIIKTKDCLINERKIILESVEVGSVLEFTDYSNRIYIPKYDILLQGKNYIFNKKEISLKKTIKLLLV